MEVNNQSQISTTRAPLFPAYSVQSVEKEDAQNNKEWLCNSSYSPADHTEVFMQVEEKELPKEEIYLKETKDKIKRELKKSKKKKEHKKYPIPTPESFQVPESDSIRSQLNKKTFIEETGLSFERAFRVDPKGDFENRYYEHLEQKHIAKYKVYLRIPIGCKLEEQSLWIQPLPKTDVPRYFSKKARKLLLKIVGESENCTFMKPEVSDNIFSFIPLESKSSKSSNSTHNYLKANFDGVSTSWKAEFLKAPEVKEDNFNEKQIDSELNLELKNKTTLFNKKLSESPHDIQLWLDFVDFQEELYYSQKMEETNKALPESYLTEKKVAILDKALKHNPQNVQLNITKLNLCRSLWTIDTVIKSWEQLIFLYPNNAQIWREYVIFVLTNITYFNTTRLLKVFKKCIKTLSNLSEGIMQSHEAPPDIIDIMIDIFAQLCFVLKSCGFTEKAIAAYQGLIEFNLFGLSTIESLSVCEQIPCLEPFWDSGAPRFGEDDAIGWSETIEQKKISFNKIVTQSDLSNMEDDILYQKLPEWRIWLEFEKLRESHYWLPWRPNPEYDQTADDIDDLNRIISFDDISHFIFRIQNEEHKFLLVHNFLKFLGFNPHLFGCNSCSEKKIYHRIDIDNFDVISKKLSSSLFSDKNSNPLCFKNRIWNAENVNFIKNVFSQTRGKFSSEYRVLLSLMYLKYLQKVALECDIESESIENAKKCAKSMLQESENRNCLLLWYEYIKIESCSSSKRKAKKIAETLFSSSSSAVISGTMPLKELWYFARSCIVFSLNLQENCAPDNELFSKNEIIWLLIHIGSREKYLPYSNELIKPTQILKTASGFKYFLNEELSSIVNIKCNLCYCLDPYAYSVIDCLRCFAFFQYFTQGLDAAILVFKELSESVNEKVTNAYKRYILEQICVSQAELLNFHTRNSTVSIKPLLLYLYDSVKQYPNNIKLLHILVRWKNASAVVGPTRRFFCNILKEPYKADPVTWIFALASELSISYSISVWNNSNSDMQLFEAPPSSTGIKWKIRSIYEKALNSASCANIPILWRSYMKFEMINNETEKCKSIYHRALQNCGWSKELILDCVEYFPDDLKQILDFVEEKVIRIHTPIEEINLLVKHVAQL
ncbi:nuclear exosome regulator NRDE2 [Trichonephila inaurata madagascariensis]|uniref:Nuclear exosome regulator NRDE2 n=1 Tax=Trichonephila inaurata madagascariensis TaxID=2747483 RepID=A0A8X6YH65_9ARAC|nr:nuclear exosome regulator NRDE2 [Trichonephila inaurata madagascariensis]